MQKEATPVIIAEDSFTKTIPARSSEVIWGVGGEFPPFFFTPLCICKRVGFVFLFLASSRFVIRTRFIHLCIFICKDQALTPEFCFTSRVTDTNASS